MGPLCGRHPRARRAGHRGHIDAAREPACARRRQQRQLDGRCKTAGAGHQLGTGDRLAVELRQPVDGRCEQVRGLMRPVIPAGIVVGALEPVVGREVDHRLAGADEGLERLHRFAVRHRAEDEVGLVEQLLRRGIGEAELRQLLEVAVHRADQLPCAGATGGMYHLHIFAGQEEAEQLTASISRRAEDGDPGQGEAPSRRPSLAATSAASASASRRALAASMPSVPRM